GQIKSSIEKMLEILPQLDRRPELLAQKFTWFELMPTPIMSGYYTPELEASLTRRPGYDVPIYSKPRDLKIQQGSTGTGPRFYRVEKGKTLPYYSRREIEAGAIKDQAKVIAWTREPYDLFNLQVEGAGRLVLPDGTIRTVVYEAKNGRKFKGLGAILRDRKLLPPEKLTLPHIRAFCKKNPALAKELMAENESYIFFRFGEVGAEGTIGRQLTPMVSLATDPRLLPLGTMVVMNTDIPADGGYGLRKVRGLGLAQDTGAAIKGARLDYYVGEGERAESVGCRIWNEAKIYLLVSRDVMGDERTKH
ncbi:MAG: MltA domain-containing protein, partial [Proteobacteria bacterium]|nr:MltA domain-containing protein [Pseudomonadota bacterium]MBU1611444.1 MltA domain-containing protein [Pseudomonadota bacterium]